MFPSFAKGMYSLFPLTLVSRVALTNLVIPEAAITSEYSQIFFWCPPNFHAFLFWQNKHFLHTYFAHALYKKTNKAAWKCFSDQWCFSSAGWQICLLYCITLTTTSCFSTFLCDPLSRVILSPPTKLPRSVSAPAVTSISLASSVCCSPFDVTHNSFTFSQLLLSKRKGCTRLQKPGDVARTHNRIERASVSMKMGTLQPSPDPDGLLVIPWPHSSSSFILQRSRVNCKPSSLDLSNFW